MDLLENFRTRCQSLDNYIKSDYGAQKLAISLCISNGVESIDGFLSDVSSKLSVKFDEIRSASEKKLDSLSDYFRPLQCGTERDSKRMISTSSVEDVLKDSVDNDGNDTFIHANGQDFREFEVGNVLNYQSAMNNQGTFESILPKSKTSDIPVGDVQMKTNLPLPTTEPSGIENNGTITCSIQYLIVSRQLKITIGNICNMAGNFKKDKEIIVKVNLLTGANRQKKQIKSTTGNNSFELNKDVYFKKINIEDAHMSSIRIRVIKKNSKWFWKKGRCIGEIYVPLENINIIEKVQLCSPLLELESR